MFSKQKLLSALKFGQMNRGMIWGMLITGALVSFELFNFSTTDFAMTDLLGDLRFAGIRWATILAIAFCSIDFAGIARLFTPEEGTKEPAEAWYLFSAWLLAATMNAILTWWGISIAIANHTSLGSAVIPRETLLTVVPVFVAIMVWLIRVLIIGTFSVAGNRMFSQDTNNIKTQKPKPVLRRTPQVNNARRVPAATFRPAPKANSVREPGYNAVSMKANQAGMQSYRD